MKSLETTAIRDAVADLDAVKTILGTFRFDENGDAVYDPIIQITRRCTRAL